ncbi:MAG: alpha/beta hydrolase family protein [Nocardioides sp.]
MSSRSTPGSRPDRRRVGAGVASALFLLLGSCATAEPDPGGAGPTGPTTGSAAPAGPTASSDPPSADPGPGSEQSGRPGDTRPVSLPAYFDRDFAGSALRLGVVRERTAAYTSYDVTYRSETLRITGVLNVPRGKGPFPAVVLAHGYIDPEIYQRGQGMTRERGFLASEGYVALHVDYRNHAESDEDPDAARQLRLGYSVDVINAVNALRAAENVAVDDDRIFLMGRSMGGGVIYKALEMAPGLVSGAAAWAPVSSLEAENYNRWIRGDVSRNLDPYISRKYGLPGEPGSRRFWREISSRTYFDRITEPVLIVQGGGDDQCPPRWARATYRAMLDAGVDAELAWYDGEEHAFGPRFFDAMERTVRFFATH